MDRLTEQALLAFDATEPPTALEFMAQLKVEVDKAIGLEPWQIEMTRQRHHSLGDDLKEPIQIDFRLRKTWLEALRSGYFKQCFHAWSVGEELCALGVAWRAVLYGHKQTLEDAIPQQLRERVIFLNDGMQWDFPRIAGWLERNTRASNEPPQARPD